MSHGTHLSHNFFFISSNTLFENVFIGSTLHTLPQTEPLGWHTKLKSFLEIGLSTLGWLFPFQMDNKKLVMTITPSCLPVVHRCVLSMHLEDWKELGEYPRRILSQKLWHPKLEKIGCIYDLCLLSCIYNSIITMICLQFYDTIIYPIPNIYTVPFSTKAMWSAQRFHKRLKY